MNSSYFFLVLAIVSEVIGTTCMKLSIGFSQIMPSIAMAVFYILSLTSLTIAVKNIDISVGYAIWSGLGTVLITIIGTVYFKEVITISKMISILLIVIGVVGLNLNNSHQ